MMPNRTERPAAPGRGAPGAGAGPRRGPGGAPNSPSGAPAGGGFGKGGRGRGGTAGAFGKGGAGRGKQRKSKRAKRQELEQMAREVETFATALKLDLLDAGDFVR